MIYCVVFATLWPGIRSSMDREDVERYSAGHVSPTTGGRGTTGVLIADKLSPLSKMIEVSSACNFRLNMYNCLYH